MQAQYVEIWRNQILLLPLLGFRPFAASRVSCRVQKAQKKDNVWSIDNDFASKKSAIVKKKDLTRRNLGKKVKSVSKHADSTVMVSRTMLTEIETVLQNQEPVLKPSWDIFASSHTGIWKGLGAVFSPFTAELEPISVGNQNEYLFDCYTLSRIEKIASEGFVSQIHRKTNWVAFNPFGEARRHLYASKQVAGSVKSSTRGKLISDAGDTEFDLPSYESFDLSHSEISEEDSLKMEPGLVFFEGEYIGSLSLLTLPRKKCVVGVERHRNGDGSYSKGPVNIPVGEYDESEYFLSPTYQFEQCLVTGSHKRLRIVHTIEFNEGGSSIQITRVAVYEEEWASPVDISIVDGTPFDLKPISQRRRIQPSELAGSWKVFEVCATPVFGDVEATEEGDPPLVFLCMETLKKRSLPRSSAELDLNDVTVLWLPGGVAAYVDVNKDGTLCIGISWYCNEGINLVMERDYGMDGNLMEVRSKSEIKRR